MLTTTKNDNLSCLWIYLLIYNHLRIHQFPLFYLLFNNSSSFFLITNRHKLKIFDSPHSGAVEMHHQPFARIERNWIGVFYSFKPTTEFRAHECTACVSRIHVQPESVLFTYFQLSETNIYISQINFIDSFFKDFKISEPTCTIFHFTYTLDRLLLDYRKRTHQLYPK